MHRKGDVGPAQSQVEHFLRTNSAYKETFESLVYCWPQRRDLVRRLCHVVFHDDQAKLNSAYARNLISGTSKDWRDLKPFCEKLKNVARDIETFNRSIPRYDLLADWHGDELPNRLRAYAKTLYGLCDIEKYTSGESAKGHRSYVDIALSEIIQVVRSKKKRPMYAEVALLLTGTGHALGFMCDDEEYTADNIKVRLARMKKVVSPSAT